MNMYSSRHWRYSSNTVDKMHIIMELHSSGTKEKGLDGRR